MVVARAYIAKGTATVSDFSRYSVTATDQLSSTTTPSDRAMQPATTDSASATATSSNSAAVIVEVSDA
jgi:hypothetical protein